MLRRSATIAGAAQIQALPICWIVAEHLVIRLAANRPKSSKVCSDRRMAGLIDIRNVSFQEELI
jgi:hypothetical protein